MNPAAKLAGFAGLLVLVFGVGRRAPGARSVPSRSRGQEAHGSEPDPVRGLSVADGGLKLALEPLRAGELRFEILDAEGRPVRDYEVEHEQRMHVIVVRRDGRGFQHVHPRARPRRRLARAARAAEAGAYRVFADFVHDGEAETLAADLAVDGDADCGPLPAPAATAPTRPTVTTCASTPRPARRRRGRAELHRQPRRRAGPHRALPRRRRPPRGAARGRPRLPARAPEERRRRGQLHGGVPERGPLPPLPPVQARGRVHTAEFTQRGGAVSATREHLELPITGMTCASCANRIERGLNKLDGVSASVNYATERASVDFDAARRRRRAARGAVEAAGYRAALPARRRRPATRTPSRADGAAAPPADRVGACSSLPVLVISMVPAFQFENWQWLALSSATPVVLWGAGRSTGRPGRT